MSDARFQRALAEQLSLAAERYGGDLPLLCQASAPLENPPQQAEDLLGSLAEQVAQCQKCKLHEGRKNVVFGEGSPQARVMFVGEAPGAREDEQGRPFVGPAGQLLTDIIEKGMRIPRAETFIVNVNKCRPPGNRDPEPDEVAACLPYLRQQVEIIAPRVIVAMGRVAAQNLLSRNDPVGRMRGKKIEYQGIPVVVTWHPAYLLRNPAAKADTWQDIQRAMALLDQD
ncbi:MAG: uracil-DNA glycosylase [Planctomycetota bacterium]